jgi:hypothetical protein
MKKTNFAVFHVFQMKPEQWGLRGDYFLWNEMQEYMSTAEPPQTNDEFENLFYKTFKELVGEDLEAEKTYRVEKYAHGGVSGGMIDGNFWKSKAWPLLSKRYSVHLKANREITESECIASRKPIKCSNCGSKDILPIVYGLPAPETFEEAEKGLIKLGGCVIFDNDPSWECNDCGVQFYKK